MSDYSYLVPMWQAFVDEKLFGIHQRFKDCKELMDAPELARRIEKAKLPVSAGPLLEAFLAYARENSLDGLQPFFDFAQEVVSEYSAHGVRIELTRDYAEHERQIIQAVEWLNFYILELKLPGVDLPTIQSPYVSYANWKEAMSHMNLNSKLEVYLEETQGPYQVASSPLSVLKLPQWQCYYCGEWDADPRGERLMDNRHYCHLEVCTVSASGPELHKNKETRQYCCFGNWRRLRASVVNKVKRVQASPEDVQEVFFEFYTKQFERLKTLPPMRSLLTPMLYYKDRHLPRTQSEIRNWDDCPNIDAVG